VMMKLEAYHQSFLKVINALIHVDESLAFCHLRMPMPQNPIFSRC